METLPTSRRPGRHGPWRQGVKAAAKSGEIMEGGAESPHAARLIGKKIRAAALAEGLKARMSYAEPAENGYTCWYASIATQEGVTQDDE